MTINVGPQHPSTHGVLRLVLTLDGERILNVKPVIGYLHRGMEKMAESGTYFQYLPMVDRIDYLSGIMCAEAYCQSVEKLCGLEVPIKAQYIRVLLAELNRISSHLMWLGSLMLDLGASSPIFYCFEQREKILRIFENLCGQRMMYNYHIFGGVKFDIDENFISEVKNFAADFIKRVDEVEKIITNNPIFISRTKGLGILSKETAKEYGITGANLRSTGINIDFRKSIPYLCYENIDFDIPTSDEGDCYSRYILRINEMRESLKIINQCIKFLTSTNETVVNIPSVKPFRLSPQKNTAVSFIESSRGLMSCIVISDGSNKPFRVKWRTASFFSVQVLPILLKGTMLADIMAIFGSFDVILPEVDR